jgi:MtN3 and saliva related transmembrane protein
MYEYIKYFIELGFGLSMFLNAIVFIPQAVKLYKIKDPKGLSLTTFLGFNVTQIFAIFYGYIKKDYILMLGFALTFILCAIVTLEIYLYGKHKKIM